MLGPGIIMVGVSMAAGEFIPWPYVTSVAGPGLLWLAIVPITIASLVIIGVLMTA